MMINLSTFQPTPPDKASTPRGCALLPAYTLYRTQPRAPLPPTPLRNHSERLMPPSDPAIRAQRVNNELEDRMITYIHINEPATFQHAPPDKASTPGPCICMHTPWPRSSPSAPSPTAASVPCASRLVAPETTIYARVRVRELSSVPLHHDPPTSPSVSSPRSILLPLPLPLVARCSPICCESFTAGRSCAASVSICSRTPQESTPGARHGA
ncbi:hypothetical protein C8Q79DRAFT_121220 [Trametes meyenii]|nr:hypothetical protein C8Q79DRAFT_121220 [Trametes meyenii]